MFICIKQYQSKFDGPLIKNLSNAEVELNKGIAYKKNIVGELCIQI